MNSRRRRTPAVSPELLVILALIAAIDVCAAWLLRPAPPAPTPKPLPLLVAPPKGK